MESPDTSADGALERLERARKRASGVIKDARVAARNRRIGAFIVSFPKTGRTWLRVMIGKALIERYHLRPRAPARHLQGQQSRPGRGDHVFARGAALPVRLSPVRRTDV
jgi:ribosomal 50S subunit-associated protein YjgA (DUF615 family)